MQKKHPQFSRDYISRIAIILVLLVFFIPLILSYSNYYPPFLEKKYIYLLDSIVADIPLLPKTPKQVITKALFRNRNLTSYTMTTNIKLETDKQDKFKLIDLTLDSKIENALAPTFKSKIMIHGEVNFFQNPKIAVTTVKDKSNYYLKVDQFPTLAEFNLAMLPEGWTKFDLSEFQKSLGVRVRNDQQIIDDVRAEFTKIQDSLVEKSIFSKVVSFKKTLLRGETFYVAKINLEATVLQKLPLLGENLKLEKPILTLLINSKSLYLTEANLEGKINGNMKDTASKESGLKLKIGSKLSQLGKKQNIQFPKATTNIKSSIDFALKINQTDTSVNNFLTVTKNSKDLGDNLLTLERLLTVIILLPKAI